MQRTFFITLLGLLFIGFAHTTSAQSYYKSKKFQSYRKGIAHGIGDFRLRVGIGGPSALSTNTGGVENFFDVERSTVPPLHITGEYGFSDRWSGGIYAGYTSESVAIIDTEDIGFDYAFTTQYAIFGVRGSYHFNGGKRTKFDPYVSGMIAYQVVTIESPGELPFSLSGNAPGYSVNVGANYMFNKYFGGFAEVGFGVAYANVGLVLSM